MLTLRFIPRFELENWDDSKKLDRLIKIVKNNEIVLLEGKLDSRDEAELISRTMEAIDDDFSGIEISTIRKNDSPNVFHKLKNKVVEMLLGDRFGFTIIGPAEIVEEIKNDPDKIQLMIKKGKQGKS